MHVELLDLKDTCHCERNEVERSNPVEVERCYYTGLLRRFAPRNDAMSCISSIITMQWNLKPKAPEEFTRQFPEYSSIVLQLFYDRKLLTAEEISKFLGSDYQICTHDPFLIKGVKEACERIKLAIEKDEKIMVVGDYDADGVCGLTILSQALRELGAKNLDTYIPDREKEGYGLNLGIAKVIAERGFDLVITVDCGISDREEIKFLKEQNIQTIVVDHHLVPEILPPAEIIINPKQKDDTYPFKGLCATGLAFKLTQALFSQNESIKKGREKWFLDLVAIATVADVMPLLDENRVFVKYGLYVLSKTRRMGLRELMNTAQIKPLVIDNDLLATNLNTRTIGFQIAPRINVASRMDHANVSYELMVTDSLPRAKTLAEYLENQNRRRQEITEQIIREVDNRLASKKTNEELRLIFEYGEDWPAGVLGIIAGKLAEKYFVPAVILSKKEDKSVGSARSIPAFNITEALAQSKDILMEFGGHRQAAGLTVKNENLEALKNNLTETVRSKLSPEDFIPRLDIDCELNINDVSWNLYEDIEKFSPFGEGNPRPKFLIKRLIVKDIQIIGNGSKHLKLKLSQEDQPFKLIKAIGFGFGHWFQKLKLGDQIDAVVEIIADEWNGNRELQLNIVDLKA